MKRHLAAAFLSAVTFLILPALVRAADWPQWRYDANRSGASPQELPAKLYLEWMRDNAALIPAWPDQAKMQFDLVREPVVKDQTLYINSSRNDYVRALEMRTGLEKWRFYADGPVRFAPAT